MTFKTALAAVIATALIGCADMIEVPEDNGGNNAGGMGRIVYNDIDPDGTQDSYPTIRMIDSNGTFIKSLGLGGIWGSGKNTLAYAVIAPEISEGAAYIYVNDNNGGNARKIASVTAPGQNLYFLPIVSYDGSRVIYSTLDSMGNGVYDHVLRSVKADGSGERIISRSMSDGAIPALSRNGNEIAYFHKVGLESDQLVIASSDGTGSRVIVSGIQAWQDLISTISTISWNIVTNMIAYSVGFDSEAGGVFVVNPDGSGLGLVAARGWRPSWSDDGAQLAWTAMSEDKTNSEIAISSDLGVTVTTLTNTMQSETHPQISPDGKKVLCTIWEDEATASRGSLEVIDIATKEAKLLADPSFGGLWLK